MIGCASWADPRSWLLLENDSHQNTSVCDQLISAQPQMAVGLFRAPKKRAYLSVSSFSYLVVHSHLNLKCKLLFFMIFLMMDFSRDTCRDTWCLLLG